MRTGADKTTTMRVILGLARPTGGAVTVNGKPFAGLFSVIREVSALLDATATLGLRALLQWNERTPGCGQTEVPGLPG
jgi:ABC-type oligopeptide transport system ATPase subunit